ncbi:hypothetical protein SAMN04487967_2910 [Natronorubrum sediminis]|uniref:Uncharacterized protein n=1 Tax=Natronorubrum sediminis TaxID=640943 RepID=A0A1H6G1N9_9EURY|nr:hypothetical protein [Natronorubrum sediminis]SEH16997.1 hypothetical protein SAMN04487967_2910 [Natronorubrum sediminis]
MRKFLESDTGFYYAIGFFIIAIFVVALAVLVVISPVSLGAVELVGFVGGFVLFMLVYFVAISVHRLEGRNET